MLLVHDLEILLLIKVSVNDLEINVLESWIYPVKKSLLYSMIMSN